MISFLSIWQFCGGSLESKDFITILISVLGISVFSAFEFYRKSKKDWADYISNRIEDVIKQVYQLSFQNPDKKGAVGMDSFSFYISYELLIEGERMDKGYEEKLNSIRIQIDIIIEELTKQGTSYRPIEKDPFNLHLSVVRLKEEVIKPFNNILFDKWGTTLDLDKLGFLIEKKPFPQYWLKKLDSLEGAY